MLLLHLELLDGVFLLNLDISFLEVFSDFIWCFLSLVVLDWGGLTRGRELMLAGVVLLFTLFLLVEKHSFVVF